MALLDLIPGVTTLRNICIGICITAACTSFAGLYGYHKGKVKAEAIAAQKALAIASQRETEARVASENFRRTEKDLKDRVETAEGKLHALETQHASVIAADRATIGKLRNDLATYARSSDPASDTQSACSDRAAALGDLLGEALSVSAENASAAESSSDAVRALLEAWPSP